MNIHVAILTGLAAGLLFGLGASLSGIPAWINAATAIAPLGGAFMSLIKMVVLPLVATTLFSGVAGLGNLKKLGKMGGLSLLFFWVTSFLAIAIGMVTMWLALPLASDPASLRFEDLLPAVQVAGSGATEGIQSPITFLLGLIPENPIGAAAEGALLPVIIFVALLGAATASLPESDRTRLISISDSLAAALIKLVHWILLVAPVGVFALAAPFTARTGMALIQSLAVFILAVIVALLIFAAVVYLPAVALLGRVKPGFFLKACVGPVAIACSVLSSSATLPAMLEVADKELKLSKLISSFVLALGASINRAGSALFQGAAVIFLAYLYEVPISAGAMGGIILATFLVSLTVAGVPSASLVTLAPALSAAGIPLDGIALLFGIDRIPDMARTATNVTGHLAAATIVDKWSGVPPAGETA